MAHFTRTGATLTLDVQDVQNQIDRLQQMFGPDRAERMLNRICRYAGRQVRHITHVRQPEDYNVTNAMMVGVQGRMQALPGQPGVRIPFRGKKYTIGGRHIQATGGVAGWQSMRFRGNPYPIDAAVLANGLTRLPRYTTQYGVMNAPFRNLTAPKLNHAVFIRTTKKRFPIMPVKALAVPQMPVNRSEENITNDIYDALNAGFEDAFNQLI